MESRAVSPKQAFGSVSVVIPAYNAQDELAATLRSVQSYMDRAELDHEIIVVDDGSTDRTAGEALKHDSPVKLLQNEGNRGKGYSVRRGMLEATRKWVVFMDVDNSTSLNHLDRFAAHASEFDVLIASRRLPESRIIRHQPVLRQMLGRTFPYIARTVCLPSIHDTQCGFKAFRRDAVVEVFTRQQTDGFCFDVEILLIAKRLGFRIKEIAVDWDNPPRSTVRMSLDPCRMLLDVFRIVWRHRPSRYAAMPARTCGPRHA